MDKPSMRPANAQGRATREKSAGTGNAQGRATETPPARETRPRKSGGRPSLFVVRVVRSESGRSPLGLGRSKNGGRSRLLAALAVPVALASCLLLAACGGSDSPSSAASKEAASEQKAETENADFAKCMREHGVNAEAVSGPNGGHGLKVSPGSAGSSPAAMEAAEKACAKYRPEPKKVNLSPQQKVENEEDVRKFAKCMREHGIKVEASTSGGGAEIRIGIHSHGGAGEPNPESPGFQQAQSACQKLLPKGPGGGSGPATAPGDAVPAPGASAGGEGGSAASGG